MNNIKLLSVPQDFRKANGMNTFSRSHLHIQILFLSPRTFLHLLFLLLRGVHQAWIQKSSHSQILPSLLHDRAATAVCPCPSPARRSTGKANLTHLVIPKWYSVGYIEYFHLSNCFLSLGVIKLKADKGKGLHKGACGLEGDSSHLESPWTRRGWQALIQALRPSSSQKVLCTKAGHICSCQVFRWFKLPEFCNIFKWISWFLKMLALNTKYFNQITLCGPRKMGPKAKDHCQFLKLPWTLLEPLYP